MVELQLLNYVIINKKIDLLLQNNITPDRFSPEYLEEVLFVYNHFQKYGKVPDYPTMLANFEDFQPIEVLESPKYLVETFREALIQRMQVDTINKWGETLGGTNSIEALNFITAELEAIRNIGVGELVGVNIIEDTSRLGKYNEAVKNPGFIGFKTGVSGLDEIMGGILENDLVVIAARTNQGKSFWGLKISANIWAQDNSILFYSGENSVLHTGYRFDTLVSNFSNSALMFGGTDLKNGKTQDDYDKYMKELAKSKIPFVVVTPQELNGHRIGIHKVEALYQLYKPKIIFLDQLSLMQDDRGTGSQSERFKYSHVMEDLRNFVETKHVPVVIMAQTSRNNVKNDDGILEPARIEHLSESDGVGTNATKIITFAVNKGQLHAIVRKNTYGEKERGFKMIWDIDTGVFSDFTEPDAYGDYVPGDDAPPEPANGDEIF